MIEIKYRWVKESSLGHWKHWNNFKCLGLRPYTML